MRIARFTVAALLVACGAATPGANPTDMSMAEHQAAAQAHDQQAAAHANQYNADASVEQSRCSGASRGSDAPCWSVYANPTQAHLDEAERHRKMAADHRSASDALRGAEAQACGGLAETDRDTSPFDRRDDIVSVDDFHVHLSPSKSGPNDRIVGASITVRAVPGLTKEYLQRLVSCHLARNASMGFAMPEMAPCPLSVKGATAVVESTSGGFRVDIRSDDTASVAEIRRRAQALTAH